MHQFDNKKYQNPPAGWQNRNKTIIEATLLEYYKIEKKINIGQCVYLCRPL